MQGGPLQTGCCLGWNWGPYKWPKMNLQLGLVTSPYLQGFSIIPFVTDYRGPTLYGKTRKLYVFTYEFTI